MNQTLKADSAARERWAQELARSPAREQPPTTVSGRPIEPLYTPDDLNGNDDDTDHGYPGQYPFTRGVHASMYRGRLWTMRQFAGFGTPRQTNERFKFLLQKGQTGLSTAFDLPTLMGLDSDHPRSAGEVGRLGVAVDTLDDMLALFDGIDLETISVSMTINAPAIVIMAFYLAAAQERGFDCAKAPRHAPERHPQGVPRPERVRVPAGAERAAGVRRDRVLCPARAAVEPGVDFRLPHPRGRLDRRPGAGFHAGRRLPLRRAVPGPRHGRGRFRPAPVVLLQRA